MVSAIALICNIWCRHKAAIYGAI